MKTGAVPLVRENQQMHQAFWLGNNNVIYISDFDLESDIRPFSP